MDKELLKKIILGIATDYDYTIHNNYSGRYMYGETCLGISLDGDLNDYNQAVSDWLTQNFDDFIDENASKREAIEMLNDARKELLNYSWDSLGKGIIVYYKSIKGD